MTNTTIATEEFVNAVAAEMASGVESAVESWMAQVDQALEDSRLTTLGRMNAVREIVQTYKHLTGKKRLELRSMDAIARPA
jgi:hypothetical protein